MSGQRPQPRRVWGAMMLALSVEVWESILRGRPVMVRGLDTARITAPPTVQIIGLAYTLKVHVRNTGPWVKNLCLDFTDDNNSWLTRMPGLRAYDSDTFCVRFLKKGRRSFRATVIPGKAGVHKMSVTIGKATIFPTVNDAIIRQQRPVLGPDGVPFTP